MNSEFIYVYVTHKEKSIHRFGLKIYEKDVDTVENREGIILIPSL